MDHTRTDDRNCEDNSVDGTIGELMEPVHVTDGCTKVCEIKKIFSSDKPINAVVVLAGQGTVGLVMNIHLDRILSQRFGVALYFNKPVETIMDVSPLVVEHDMPLEKTADLAMNRESSKIFDHIVVTRKGQVAGIAPVQNILNAMLNIHIDSAVQMKRVNERLCQEIEERQKVEEELVRLNHDLEDRVMKRTAEIRESNRKLSQAVETAQAANRAKSDFLANMSHELRTPLNHIMGFTELVLEQYFGELNKTQAEYLTDVLNSSRHLLSLINDILDLAKIEAGKLELYRTEIDVKNLLKNSIVMIKEKAQKHNIRISTQFQDIPETIEGDARKLKQILYNLLSNSVKFTPDGGSISLNAKRYTMTSLSKCRWSRPACADTPDEFLEIAVQDTGIGLKEEDKTRIFSPFEQADGSTSRKYQGTGLGLSLTKKIVELHSGRIWAQSDGPGKGAMFCFVIPTRQPENHNSS